MPVTGDYRVIDATHIALYLDMVKGLGLKTELNVKVLTDGKQMMFEPEDKTYLPTSFSLTKVE